VPSRLSLNGRAGAPRPAGAWTAHRARLPATAAARHSPGGRSSSPAGGVAVGSRSARPGSSSATRPTRSKRPSARRCSAAAGAVRVTAFPSLRKISRGKTSHHERWAMTMSDAPDQVDEEAQRRDLTRRRSEAYRDRRRRGAVLVAIELEPRDLAALERLALLAPGDRDAQRMASAAAQFLAAAPQLRGMGAAAGDRGRPSRRLPVAALKVRGADLYVGAVAGADRWIALRYEVRISDAHWYTTARLEGAAGWSRYPSLQTHSASYATSACRIPTPS
jgi:hypothetical protein